jgi:hypothetical protein
MVTNICQGNPFREDELKILTEFLCMYASIEQNRKHMSVNVLFYSIDACSQLCGGYFSF